LILISSVQPFGNRLTMSGRLTRYMLSEGAYQRAGLSRSAV
jgi:hypothetical protein